MTFMKMHTRMRTHARKRRDFSGPKTKGGSEGLDWTRSLVRFSGTMQRLKTGEMAYRPGEGLTLDGISVFASVNSAIQTYRPGL